MLKTYKALILIFVSIIAQAQGNFQKGYYIDLNNVKHEGYIDDLNPHNCPSEIRFKVNLTDESFTVIDEKYIQEYTSNNNYKFQKFTIQFDSELTNNRNPYDIVHKLPVLETKTVLVKLLVEGNNSLYSAVIKDKTFFYLKKKDIPEPIYLVYKKYIDGNRELENASFRGVLHNEFSVVDSSLTFQDFSELKYDQNVLIKLFERINSKDNSLIKNEVDNKRNKLKFSLTVLLGYSFSNFETNIYQRNQNSSSSSPLVGFELSLGSPFDAKRFEFFGRFGAEKIDSKISETENYNLESTIVEKSVILSSLAISASIGPRYYFNLNNSSRIFIDTSFGLTTLSGDFEIQNAITRYINLANPTTVNNNYSIGLKNGIFLNFGVGYWFKNKFGLDLRYTTPRQYFDERKYSGENFYSFKHSSFSTSLLYKIF
ncbi:MAG: hypothetical protein J0L86_05935 [Flavobacteriales bacterium]|nr:hypothetical protein [Flavobacteriales bacterium]